jgi:hypothetical protein
LVAAPENEPAEADIDLLSVPSPSSAGVCEDGIATKSTSVPSPNEEVAVDAPKSDQFDRIVSVMRKHFLSLMDSDLSPEDGEDVLVWARKLGRDRTSLKDSEHTVWFQVEKRKVATGECFYVCLKLNDGQNTSQLASLRSDTDNLCRHALLFKAIVLTAAEVDESVLASLVFPALRDVALDWV